MSVYDCIIKIHARVISIFPFDINGEFATGAAMTQPENRYCTLGFSTKAFSAIVKRA